MRDADYWRRRYERAEAGRLQALSDLQAATRTTINAAADEMQQQIDALELLILRRAALVGVVADGRKLRFTFQRRGALHQVECYNAMGLNVEELQRVLLGDE